MTRNTPSRRDLLAGLSGAVAAASLANTLKAPLADAATPANSLGQIAAEKGILFGASFAVHELQGPNGKDYAEMYVRDARVLTSELEFKLATLRPTPDKIDFYDADRLVDFAEAHAMRVRAHTLIWNDALPDWIKALPDADARDLLDTHIETVTTRFGNRIAIWDVVNEPIGPWDGNPGNLRGGPFYRALGEGYIKRAFDVARHFVPTATLVLNEAQTETNDANGATFRDSLFALLKRLKAEGAPIDAVGIQSHIQASKPYDFAAYAGYLAEIADLGYAIHLTELDVNDTGIDGGIAERDAKVAGLYESYLGAVLQVKAVKVVELWQLSDGTSWMNDRSSIGRIEMRANPRPLIYDAAFKKKPAWDAVARALSDAPSRSA